MSARYKRVGKKGQLEHRYVMEQHLGRKLLRTEQVHHINGDKFDNRLENLAVMSASEHMRLHNQKYPYKKVCVICGREYEPCASKRKTGKVCSMECKVKLDKKNAAKRKRRIIQMSMGGELIKSWESARDAQEETGFFESNINKCCNGHIRSYKGFVWRFE